MKPKKIRCNCKAVDTLEIIDHEFSCNVVQKYGYTKSKYENEKRSKYQRYRELFDQGELEVLPSLYWEGEDFDGLYKEDGCPWIFTE